MESAESKQWICKATELEKNFDILHKKGRFVMIYQLSLSSVHPLLEGHVRQALIHLQRKCPSLRIVFSQRNGETWLQNTINEDIDFEVVRGLQTDEMRDLLQNYQYKSKTRPLWCARLLLDDIKNPHTLDEGFPHTSHLFLRMTHSVSDGITLLYILSGFTIILNDVIAGKLIDDEKQIGNFVSDAETEKIVEAMITRIHRDAELMKEMTAANEDKGIGMPLLLSVIPPPEGEDKTNNLTHVLDRETTRAFISKCKAEGVAIHSAFVALTNAAAVTLLVEKQYIRDSYRLCNGHLVNLRRYWSNEVSHALGCHAHFPMNLWVQVPRDITEKFWDFARYLHKDVHHHLKKESVLLQEAYTTLKSRQQTASDEKFNSMQVDSSFSNLGDVTPSLTEGGPHVKPFLLVRHSSNHTDIQNFVHFFHTYREKFMLNLLYNTKYFTRDMAQKYCTQIFNILKKVIATDDS